MGCVFRVLHGDRVTQMGPPLSHSPILLPGRRSHARAYRTCHGKAGGPLDRRRHQFSRLAFTVRTSLGHDRASSFLHFELCYYQAIDYAIAHKIPRVEAGAQGEHKIARGYLPATTYSAHYIADRGLRRAIADYLVRERAYVAAAGNELATLTPFRKNLPLESD